MRIIFMGTPEFAVVSLYELLHAELNIIAVVTVPDKPKGRGQIVQPSPVKQAAFKEGLPVFQPEKLRDRDFVKRIHDLQPDLITVVAFRILPEDVFSIPSLGTINLHGSLLPKYRGAAPINWAIINGETMTGATTFFIRKEVDTGSIIDTVQIRITPDMTAGELHDIMAVKGAKLLVKTCRRIAEGSVTIQKQDETLSTKAPKIHKEDCQVNFDQPAQQVHNFIRGLSPYPAAYSKIKGKVFKLFKSEILSGLQSEEKPGTINISKKMVAFEIACNPGKISVSDVQLEGKKRMPVAEFLRGYAFNEKTILHV